MGSVVLSIDAELAWGFVDFPQLPQHRLARAREMWKRLGELLDRYDVPATWAIVGHLFLEDCDGTHTDHPADEDWFHRDPGRPATCDDVWYSPALVERIIDTDVGHEIGCHSFSHVDFRADGTTRETADAELRRCRELAAEWGIEMESFVFPRNRIGHRDALAAHEFSCYRASKPQPWYGDTGIESFLKAVSGSNVGITPPTVTPRVDEYGLVAIPSSLFLFCFEGSVRRLAETVWGDPVVKMARRGIDNAIATDGLVHIWLHPNNLVDSACVERMAAILSYIDEKRQAEGLSVKTMREVAATYDPERRP